MEVTQRRGTCHCKNIPEGLRWPYNPGQNYLRAFFSKCALSCTTKLFPKQQLCGKKSLPLVQCCFLQMVRDQACFEHTTTVLPGGGGEGRISTATMFRKNAPQVCNLLNSFVKIVAFHIGFFSHNL